MTGSGIDLDSLAGPIAAAVATPGTARAVRIDHAGAVYWVKRSQDRGWFLRWQKGDPAILIQREGHALQVMNAAGLPVPQIVAQGPGYLAITDIGIALDVVWRLHPERQPEIACAAATALALLHEKGMAHGSPHLRNLTQGADSIGFIDLEKAVLTVDTGPSGDHVFHRDLVVFLYSLFGLQALPAVAQSALDAYSAIRGPQSGPAFARLVLRRGWLIPVLKLLRWHERRYRPHRSPKVYEAMCDLHAFALSNRPLG